MTSPWHPRAEDLPAECAVFPLPGALLLPHGKLPLNIFEPRYLAMVEDSLAAGRMFAMIQPDATQNAGPNGPALYRVGCLGRLVSFSETEDGRFLIQLTGLARFRVAQELETRRGYRRVRADYAPYHADLGPPATPPADQRDALLTALKDYFTRANIDANWETVRRIPEPDLVNTLSMVCPLDPVEKQALLESATDADRAATLLALLQMGAAAGPAATAPSGQKPS